MAEESEVLIKDMEDGSTEVQLGTSPGEETLPITEEMDNLVPSIKKGPDRQELYGTDMLSGEEWLKRLGQTVVSEYEMDLASRQEWEENKAEELKLFMSYLPPKSFPWKKASNINLPFITMAVIQFHARAYDALMSNRDVVKTFLTGKEDEEKGKRVAHYMNYQILYKIPSFEQQMDKTLLQVPIMGSAFKKTYWDTTLGQVRSDWISAADLVVNYWTRDIDDAKRVTHVLRWTQDDLRVRARDGIFEKEDVWDLGPGSQLAGNEGLREAQDEALGQNRQGGDSSSSVDKPRIGLEQHRWLDLDGDGINEPVIVTVDMETAKVLRITSREFMDAGGTMRTIKYFTHYEFIPNPEGFYALGYGTLLRGLNEGGNTIINEIIDAGSLANIQGGFISKRVGAKRGNIQFEQGEFQEIDALVDDLRKHIFTFDFDGPNATLYSSLGLLFEYAKLVSSVSETMTGQLPASDTPASTVMALIEEGRKVFNGIHKRFHRAFKGELGCIKRLNSIFLNENEYYQVLGEDRLPKGDFKLIGAADFAGNIDVIPVSDPTITSRAEKIMKRKAVLEELRANPETAQNQDLIYPALKKYFEALDEQALADRIQPPPPPPDLPPEEENAAMITERPANVLPQQDHAHHMLVHEELSEGSSIADQLSPAAKSLLERHQREHLAALYLTQKEAENAATEGNAGGDVSGMA